MFSFLAKVAANAGLNKMTSSNIAIIFAPIIVYPRDPAFAEMLFKSSTVTSSIKGVLQIMIDHEAEIFIDIPQVERRSSIT